MHNRKQNIINNLLNSWPDFECSMKHLIDWKYFYNILTKYNLSMMQKNDLFGKFCKYMLLYHPQLRYNFKEVKLYSEILMNSRYDKCDIIAETYNNELIPIYCIFKPNNSELSIFEIPNKYNKQIIITNGKISFNNFTYVDNYFFESSLNSNDFTSMKNNISVPMDVE